MTDASLSRRASSTRRTARRPPKTAFRREAAERIEALEASAPSPSAGSISCAPVADGVARPKSEEIAVAAGIACCAKARLVERQRVRSGDALALCAGGPARVFASLRRSAKPEASK